MSTSDLIGQSAFTYDVRDNLTNEQHQNISGATLEQYVYSYDAEGNLIQKVAVASGETWTYSYDNANHQVSATDKGSGGAVISQVTEKYDALGQRVEEDTTTAGTTTVQRFSYDTEGNVWADLDGSNTIQTRRMYDDAGGLLARISASGTVGWYLTDHLGSVRAITNGSGAVIDEASYDAFGNVVSETNPANGDRYKWDGYQYQATLGQYYVAARWYNPSTGTWTSQDPLGFDAGDSNLQRYVGNDATNGTDPTGLSNNLTRQQLKDGTYALYYKYDPSGVKNVFTLGLTYFVSKTQSPVWIGYWDPATNLVRRGARTVTLKQVMVEATSTYTTDDWPAWFMSKGSDDEQNKLGAMNMGAAIGLYATRNQRAEGVEQIKGLIRQYGEFVLTTPFMAATARSTVRLAGDKAYAEGFDRIFSKPATGGAGAARQAPKVFQASEVDAYLTRRMVDVAINRKKIFYIGENQVRVARAARQQNATHAIDFWAPNYDFRGLYNPAIHEKASLEFNKHMIRRLAADGYPTFRYYPPGIFLELSSHPAYLK